MERVTEVEAHADVAHRVVLDIPLLYRKLQYSYTSAVKATTTGNRNAQTPIMIREVSITKKRLLL